MLASTISALVSASSGVINLLTILGGTNAHVVMEKAPLLLENNTEQTDSPSTGRKLFTLSANDKPALENVMKNLGIYLEQRPEIFQNDLMDNVAYTLGERRSLLQWRVAIPASTSFELIEQLNSGKVAPTREVESPRIGFIFTGQGAQWAQMGKSLYNQFPVFAAALDKCDEHLVKLGATFSLKGRFKTFSLGVQVMLNKSTEELDKDAEKSIINEAQISQPSCTAIQIALTDLLQSWNVVPVAVTGHSSGEIAAAYATGILSLQSCMAASYYRGLATLQLRKYHPDLKGSMMAVGCTKEEMEPLLESLTNKNIRIACYNSPSSLTISGDTSAIDELQAIMEAKNMFNRKLQVDVAYHSEHMSRVATSYRASLSALESPKESNIRFYSSLYGKLAKSTDVGPEYWVENLTQAVRFTEALSAMVEPIEQQKTGVNMLIELGPHSALGGPVKQILKACGANASKISYTSALVRKRDAVETALDLSSHLFVKGVSLAMNAVNLHKSGKKPTLLVDMPRYPWNHATKYWHEPRIMQKHKYRTAPRNDLLGVEAVYSNDLEPTWRNIIRIDDLPWLRHHKIQGLTLFPMSGFVAMAVEAANQRAAAKSVDFESFEIRDLAVNTPLVITEQDIEVTLTLRPYQERMLTTSESWDEFRIHSWTTSAGWKEHCKGLISVQNTQILLPETAVPDALKTQVELPTMYDALNDLGVAYGSTFRGLRDCHANNYNSTASISRVDTAQDMPVGHETNMVIHPSMLEQCISMYWPVIGAGRSPIDTIYLPSSIERLSISRKIVDRGSRAGDCLQAVCMRKSAISTKHKLTTMTTYAKSAEDSSPIICMDGLTISPIVECAVDEVDVIPRQLCYKMQWEEATKLLATDELDFSPQPLAIIHGDSVDQLKLAAALAVSIQEISGSLPSTGLLSEIDTKDKICIVTSELEKPLLATLTAEDFTQLQKALLGSLGVLWVVEQAYLDSSNPSTNMITGLSRSIRSESLLKFGTLDLHATNDEDNNTKITVILQVLKSIFHKDADTNCELEFSYRNGQLLTPRIVDDEELNEYVQKSQNTTQLQLTDFFQGGRLLKLSTGSRNTLASLHFTDQIVKEPLLSDEVEIEVRAIGLNPHDLAVANGDDETSGFGQECSGIVTAVGTDVTNIAIGTRVAGILPGGGTFATYARLQAAHTFELGNEMTFEAAASLPLSCATAHYAVKYLARVEPGENVLVYGVETAVGQALVSILQLHEVSVTALSTNPNFEVDPRTSSNVVIFAEHGTIQRLAERRPFDVLISCRTVSPDVSNELWSSLDPLGRFIDCAPQSESRCQRLDFCTGNKQFMPLNFDALLSHKPQLLSKLIQGVFDHIRTNIQCPNMRVFPCSEIESAFRILQAGDNEGKIIISPQPGDQVKATPPLHAGQILRADATYILIGGTGGLGRSMARWMLSRGARNIVLVSRSGAITDKVQGLIDEASILGANIVTRKCNVANKVEVDSLVRECSTDLPAVRGVVHGAMILKVGSLQFSKVADTDLIRTSYSRR